jgi:hypothetical protein
VRVCVRQLVFEIPRQFTHRAVAEGVPPRNMAQFGFRGSPTVQVSHTIMCVLVGLVSFREKTVILFVASHLPALFSGGRSGSGNGQTIVCVVTNRE